jgi:hypothetical protein
MFDLTIYWRGWQETQLADYQQDQGSTNHCSKYASASAINLLLGSSINGDSLVNLLEKRILRGSFRYTIFGNHNGSLVFQTANQLRLLGLLNGIKLDVHIKRGKAPDLLGVLKDGGTVCLVSVTYFKGEEPGIARGQNTSSVLAASRWVGGHIMILSVYDPTHLNTSGVCTPWGFLSSWASKDQLYWMTDEDFLRTWGRLSVFNMITVRMGT